MQQLSPAHREAMASKMAELGEITSGKRAGRTSEAEIIICDLTGVGAQDTVIAELAWKRLSGQAE